MNPNDTENQNAAPQAEPANDAAPEAAAAAPEADPIAVLEAEKADLKDKLLRLMADMENLRRRTAREITDARTYAVTNFARDMLSVKDNLERALAAIPAEVRDDEKMKGLVSGLEATGREIDNVFQRHGIARVEAMGKPLDPHLHQAMIELPSDEAEPGTIVQEMQAGYTIKERLLRPALVGVARKP